MAARAHRAATALFELAVRHAAGLPPAERAQLLDEFAVECDTTDRRAEAIDARWQATALWHAAGQPLQEATA